MHPFFFFFFNDTATTEIYTLSLHDALPISSRVPDGRAPAARDPRYPQGARSAARLRRGHHQAQTGAEGAHRLLDPAARGGRGTRSAADARLPAGAATRGLSRAVERQEGGGREQRAGCDLQRE